MCRLELCVGLLICSLERLDVCCVVALHRVVLGLQRRVGRRRGVSCRTQRRVRVAAFGLECLKASLGRRVDLLLPRHLRCQALNEGALGLDGCKSLGQRRILDGSRLLQA